MGGGSNIKIIIIIILWDKNFSQAFASIDFPSILKNNFAVSIMSEEVI